MTQASDPLSLHDRLLAATYHCVERFGLGKTTIDDVVKESGVSRATIYRQFAGGRDELLLETVAWELANYFNRNSGIPLVYGGLTAPGLTQASGPIATVETVILSLAMRRNSPAKSPRVI